MIDFFTMGGYGFYVWMSMGVALLLMLFEMIHLNVERKRIIKAIRHLIKLARYQ